MVHPILWPFPLLATMHVLNICLKHRSALDGGIDHFAKRVVDNGVIAFAPLLVHVLLFTVLKTGDESIVLVEPLNERLAALVVVCSLMAPIAKYAFVLLPSTRWPTLLRGTLQIILDTTSVTFVITCAIGACGELHSAESDSLLLQLGLLVSRIISGTIVGSSSHLLLTKGVGYSMPAIFSCADSDRCGRTARIFGSCAFQCTVSLLGIGSVPIIAAMMLREGIVILHFVVAINVFLHLKDGISADITAPLTLMRKSISPKSQGNQ